MVSILACLWYLSILGFFNSYSTPSVLIVMCTYLLLRCQLLNMYSSLSSMVIMPFPLIYRMLIYMFPLLSISHFLCFVLCNVPYQWKVLPFGLATAPRVFTSLTKPILFLCHCKGLHIVIYLDDILVLVCSKWAGKRACSFLCSLLVPLGLHINFSKSDLCLSQTFTVSQHNPKKHAMHVPGEDLLNQSCICWAVGP